MTVVTTGEVFSVRRVGDYLSSHIDLSDYIRKIMGCTQGDDGPKEVSYTQNHHAPLTPRSTQSTSLFERAVYSREFQTLRDKRVLRGEGATANSRVILN